MSGATGYYNLRKNKHVERQLFFELLFRYRRYREIRDYLYAGFGGLYFEEYKSLHHTFGLTKMISFERHEWMIPRQAHNIPYGCITAFEGEANSLIRDLDTFRTFAPSENMLIWLDYVTASELATQLSEIRALVPKLLHGDILKITLSRHTKWLNKGVSESEIVNRFENLKEQLGSQYLPEGIGPTDMTNAKLNKVYVAAVRKQIAIALSERTDLEFMPMGCYSYSDGTPMLTITGALIQGSEQADFEQRLALKEFEFSSLDWEIHDIDVPDLSLRERLDIDSKIDGKTPDKLALQLGYRLEEDPDTSVAMLSNYMKFYRYYPNYHRVQM